MLPFSSRYYMSFSESACGGGQQVVSLDNRHRMGASTINAASVNRCNIRRTIETNLRPAGRAK